ncbi:MAG: hypothetical protein J6D47_21225 [Peptostreptococcaceae bacterium]|nr:hypothetical protein [Peptostreptococcaceae bacterium]
MIAIKYAKALELLESKSLKQSEIAEKLNISLDIVKKLSQLNKIYNITDDEELLLKIKELNFKALELKHLKYADELRVVLDKLDKHSSRVEIKNACIQANNSKDKHIKDIKKLKDNSDRAIESELSRKNSFEVNIRRLKYKKEEIEVVFNNIERGLKDLDPTLAALVYNRYITVQNVNRDYQEWFLYPVVRKGAKISGADWKYMERNKIVERIWKQGSQWSYAINIILNVEEFAKYVGKNKRRNNVTELELDKDRATWLKEKDDQIKMYKRDISECDNKIEAIKNSDAFNLDLDKESRDTLTTYKNQIYKRSPIKVAGEISIRNIVIDDTKLDVVALDKDNNIVVLIKDTMKADGSIYNQIAKRYTNERFQNIRRIAKQVFIILDIMYDDFIFPYTDRIRIPVHNLKDWYKKYMHDSKLEEEIFKDYKDEVEAKCEDELRYLIALDMSKKFLY